MKPENQGQTTFSAALLSREEASVLSASRFCFGFHENQKLNPPLVFGSRPPAQGAKRKTWSVPDFGVSDFEVLQ
jgi:hypothetical protein